MNEMDKCNILRIKMKALREKHHKSISEMARLLDCDKSTLSRVEKINGKTSYSTIAIFAERYIDELKQTPKQKEEFLKVQRIAVPDTSALLKNDQLIYDLCSQYCYVVVPDIVINELDSIKNHNIEGMAAKAWRILQSITNNAKEKGGNVVTRKYVNDNEDVKLNNDQKIIKVAETASEEFLGEVDIITYDTGFSARLSGDSGRVRSVFLLDYLASEQQLTDMLTIKKIDEYYADTYDDIENKLDIKIPSASELNAYLEGGNTLIISAVRKRTVPFNQRREKIKWLIKHGAKIDKRDCGTNYFPPLSHSIQINDFDMFKFLLHECGADPNVGSRNPYDTGKFHKKGSNANQDDREKQNKNDGNMPLMIAAWDNKLKFVRELLADERTSINQQDGNGFTALIKACYWGWLDCRDALLEAGADTKIVDRDGFTAEGRYNEFLETGRRKYDRYPKKPNRNSKEWHNK